MKNKNRITGILLIILCFTTFHVKAQLEEKYTNYQELQYKGLKYGFYEPQEYNKNKSYPLVLVLNGFTDTLSHDLVYYKDSFQRSSPCFVLTPKCYGNPYEGGGWYDSFNKVLLPDGKLAIELVENTVKKYNIDTDRLYVHGGSMGGFGTFGMLSTYPEKFAAAYVVCGGAQVEIAEKLINTPLWVFHGELDDVVPVHLSRNIYNEIVKHGGEKVRYTVYPGVKHNSWENASNEKTLEAWLFKQKKGKTAGTPDKPKGLTVEKNLRDNVLSWQLPDQSNPDNNIWYYKIIRNGEVLAEVDGDVNMYKDNVWVDNEYYNYKIIAVNYYFKKSKPTETVRIKD